MKKRTGITQHYGKFRVRWSDHNGKRQSAVFNKEKDAVYFRNKKLTEVEEIKRGLKAPPQKETSFLNVANQYFEEVSNFKKSKKDDIWALKYINSYFKHNNISDISTLEIEKFKRTLLKKLSPKSVFNILTLLNSIFVFAQKSSIIIARPEVKRPRVDLYSTDYRYLKTKEEIERFLEASKKVSDRAYILYLAALSTGLRYGELCALTWEDIDFHNNRIHIKRSHNDLTKNRKSRIVILTKRLKADLLKWKSKYQKFSSTVFFTSTGTPLKPGNVITRKYFKETLKIAGFKASRNKTGNLVNYITFHSLRHTYASHFAMSHNDFYHLQTLMGHSNLNMTKRYAHLNPESFNKYENLLSQ